MRATGERHTAGQVTVTVALAYGPVWYEKAWWSESAHAYDGLKHGGEPWSAMPKAEVMAAPDDTVATVYDRAGEILGIGPGERARSLPGRSNHLSSMLVHIGFFRPSDDDGFDVQHSYAWSSRLPVVDPDGNVEYRPFTEVKYGELLVAAQSGLIDGDPLRPYICPSMPQGDIPALVEVAKVAAETARAAHAAVHGASVHVGAVEGAARKRIDDAQRAAFLWMMWRALKAKLRKKRD